jgi:hypothetical protein
MISPSELDIQSTMENNRTCTQREREREEFWLFVAFCYTIKVWFGGGFGHTLGSVEPPPILFIYLSLFLKK